MRWLALFSQSGNELKQIIEQTGRKPNLVLTNRLGPSAIDDIVPINYISNKPNAIQYNSYFKKYDIITLHGYLRIIPADACNHLIYNGHPAAIHLYPELKGKDKQEDVYVHKNKYQRMGVVIHKVTPELDDGEIIHCIDIINDTTSVSDAYEKLFLLSVSSWKVFIKNRPSIGVSV